MIGRGVGRSRKTRRGRKDVYSLKNNNRKTAVCGGRREPGRGGAARGIESAGLTCWSKSSWLGPLRHS